MWIVIGVIVGILFVIVFVTVLYVVSIRHPALPKLVKEKKIIACVGDSITFGMGVLFRAKHSYPARLSKLVGNDYQVLNYGFGSRTLLKGGDFPYTKEKQYEASLAINGDIYILMLGTNDSKPYNWNEENYKKELKEFVIGYLQLKSHPKVYLMKPPRAFSVHGKIKYDIDNQVIFSNICKIVEQTAKELPVELIDLYSLTENKPDCFADGVHPNASGYQLIAGHIYHEHLSKSLEESKRQQ